MISLDTLANNYRFWRYFFELSAIPRPSRYEQQSCEWVISYATQWGHSYKQDDFGNISVSVAANKTEMASFPSVALQGHLDMVCEQDEGTHDFFKDSLHLYVTEDGEWIRAKGTTLGADNGIAIAYMMALMDTDCSVAHGPLELIFTLDEETGLNGAANLGKDMISSNYMINIDNSIEAMCCIGCAGGSDYIAEIPILRESPHKESEQYTIEVKGLIGGHSGSEIYQMRASAIKIAERVLSELQSYARLQLYELEAGDKRNAIPRAATMKIYVQPSDVKVLQEQLPMITHAIRSELLAIDQGLTISLNPDTPADTPSKDTMVLTEGSLQQILQAIRLCPHGVFSRKSDTSSGTMLSTNLAAIHTSTTSISFVNNFRFSNMRGAHHVTRVLDSVFKVSGARIHTDNRYVAWESEENSTLEMLFGKYYENQTGNPIFTETTHGGIECGLIKKKMADIGINHFEVICIGPEIHNLHSPEEKMRISSAEDMWQIIGSMLTHASELSQ